MPMGTKKDDTLYRKVVDVTHEYFGPAADRFVTRQIQSHLNKNPSQLRKRDLAGLIDWMSLAMAVVIEDEKLVNRYVADLNVLTGPVRKG